MYSGMEDTPKPDAEWSDGDEIIDLVMSSASMKVSKLLFYYEKKII